MTRLDAVFQRLKGAGLKLKGVGLKLKGSKCKLFQKSIKYLGHVISEQGVATDPDKVAVVKNWPIPKSVSDVQSFLGFVGFYRQFIPEFSQVAKPFHELTQGVKGSGPRKKQQLKQIPFRWDKVHQEAFDRLVDLCSSTPILAFADYKRPFVLHTDASGLGLGAVLYQEDHDGVLRPVA